MVLATPHGVVKQVQQGLKRQIDFLGALLGLIILAIPFAFIALAIKLDSKGPVFFRQERVGRDGRSFKVWKFRTMVVWAVRKGLGYNVAKDDSRITRVGAVLRNWGLDELPQLIDVLKGEMSLVGPRPTLRYQVEQYTDFQRQRLQMKPGITGWALIHGRKKLSWKERIEYDVWYINNWSLLLDLKILIKTFKVVLVTREGLYSDTLYDEFKPHDGHAPNE